MSKFTLVFKKEYWAPESPVLPRWWHKLPKWVWSRSDEAKVMGEPEPCEILHREKPGAGVQKLQGYRYEVTFTGNYTIKVFGITVKRNKDGHTSS